MKHNNSENSNKMLCSDQERSVEVTNEGDIYVTIRECGICQQCFINNKHQRIVKWIKTLRCQLDKASYQIEQEMIPFRGT